MRVGIYTFSPFIIVYRKQIETTKQDITRKNTHKILQNITLFYCTYRTLKNCLSLTFTFNNSKYCFLSIKHILFCNLYCCFYKTDSYRLPHVSVILLHACTYVCVRECACVYIRKRASVVIITNYC